MIAMLPQEKIVYRHSRSTLREAAAVLVGSGVVCLGLGVFLAATGYHAGSGSLFVFLSWGILGLVWILALAYSLRVFSIFGEYRLIITNKRFIVESLDQGLAKSVNIGLDCIAEIQIEHTDDTLRHRLLLKNGGAYPLSGNFGLKPHRIIAVLKQLLGDEVVKHR
jgi:hypothetical protein